jgi:acyl carrier protein
MTSAELIKIIKEIAGDEIDIDFESSLIGRNSTIDSLNLVQICLALEDRSSTEGFNFDWTSDKAMSSLNSIFRTPETLASEYNRQMTRSQMS